MEPIEHDLRLVLVDRDVVGDLGHPERPALVALADRLELDDGRVRGLGGLDLGDHLGVGVVAGVLGREVGGGHGGETIATGVAMSSGDRPRAVVRWVMAPASRAPARPVTGRMGLHARGTTRRGTRDRTVRREHPAASRGVSAGNETDPQRSAIQGGSTMSRPIARAGAGLGAAMLALVLAAAPALACGGLIGPNGAVNLLRRRRWRRTTTAGSTTSQPSSSPAAAGRSDR